MNDLIIWQGAWGGMAIGIYVFFQLWLTGKPLGVSTGYGYLCAAYSTDKYFCTNHEYSPENRWRIWFIFGTFLGGFIAAATSPNFDYTLQFSMGSYYDNALSNDIYTKSVILFFSGVCVGFGARMANGCTSAHAIYGVAALSLHSTIIASLFFISAVATGQLLFK